MWQAATNISATRQTRACRDIWEVFEVTSLGKTKQCIIIDFRLCSSKMRWTFRILLDLRLSVIKLPVQVVPSPVNPFLHLQIYELIPSIHLALVWQGLEIHSSMFKIFINIHFIKIESKNIWKLYDYELKIYMRWYITS